VGLNGEAIVFGSHGIFSVKRIIIISLGFFLIDYHLLLQQRSGRKACNHQSTATLHCTPHRLALSTSARLGGWCHSSLVEGTHTDMQEYVLNADLDTLRAHQYHLIASVALSAGSATAPGLGLGAIRAVGAAALLWLA
jgi:hypothetical protein